MRSYHRISLLGFSLGSAVAYLVSSFESVASAFDKLLVTFSSLAYDCWCTLTAPFAESEMPTGDFGVARQVHFNTEQPQSNRGRSSNLALGVFVHRTSLCM